MIFDLIPPKESHTITLRNLLHLVTEAGGDMDTVLQIEADGEPVYVHAYVASDLPCETGEPQVQLTVPGSAEYF